MSERYTAPCPHFRQCGGCQLQNLPYPQQLRRKQKQLEELLGEFAPVRPILGMEEPSHYRNKVHAAFALDERRQIVSGIYQPGSHAIVPVDSCYIEDETADAVIRDIRAMLRPFKIQVFDERSGTGWLRHVLVRRGFAIRSYFPDFSPPGRTRSPRGCGSRLRRTKVISNQRVQ